MRMGLVHPHRATREVLARALSIKLGAEVVGFSCLENLLNSSPDYDEFVVYNMFGCLKMDRWDGVKLAKGNHAGKSYVLVTQHISSPSE